MKSIFNLLRTTRINSLKAIEGLTSDELNRIPKGFNNNIAWNYCHSIVTQYLLTYGLSKLKIDLPSSLVEQFRKGSRPEVTISDETINFFKELNIQSVNRLEEDYNNGLFENFNLYSSSYGFDLKNIEDAMMFNNIHEGLHYGYIMALKKVI